MTELEYMLRVALWTASLQLSRDYHFWIHDGSVRELNHMQTNGEILSGEAPPHSSQHRIRRPFSHKTRPNLNDGTSETSIPSDCQGTVHIFSHF